MSKQKNEIKSDQSEISAIQRLNKRKEQLDQLFSFVSSNGNNKNKNFIFLIFRYMAIKIVDMNNEVGNNAESRPFFTKLEASFNGELEVFLSIVKKSLTKTAMLQWRDNLILVVSEKAINAKNKKLSNGFVKKNYSACMKIFNNLQNAAQTGNIRAIPSIRIDINKLQEDAGKDKFIILIVNEFNAKCKEIENSKINSNHSGSNPYTTKALQAKKQTQPVSEMSVNSIKIIKNEEEPKTHSVEGDFSILVKNIATGDIKSLLVKNIETGDIKPLYFSKENKGVEYGKTSNEKQTKGENRRGNHGVDKWQDCVVENKWLDCVVGLEINNSSHEIKIGYSFKESEIMFVRLLNEHQTDEDEIAFGDEIAFSHLTPKHYIGCAPNLKRFTLIERLTGETNPNETQTNANSNSPCAINLRPK